VCFGSSGSRDSRREVPPFQAHQHQPLAGRGRLK
jgi:hypothetical protein